MKKDITEETLQASEVNAYKWKEDTTLLAKQSSTDSVSSDSQSASSPSKFLYFYQGINSQHIIRRIRMSIFLSLNFQPRMDSTYTSTA